MQLSTNRVNFTTASVAQFNYMKFLSQFRSKDKKDVQDIVTILGLHTDDVATFDKFYISDYAAPKYYCVLENRTRQSLVPYVTKKLSFNIEKTSKWFHVIIDINPNIKMECDLRTATLTMVLFGSKCYVIMIKNCYHFCKEQLGSKSSKTL